MVWDDSKKFYPWTLDHSWWGIIRLSHPKLRPKLSFIRSFTGGHPYSTFLYWRAFRPPNSRSRNWGILSRHRRFYFLWLVVVGGTEVVGGRGRGSQREVFHHTFYRSRHPHLASGQQYFPSTTVRSRINRGFDPSTTVYPSDSWSLKLTELTLV